MNALPLKAILTSLTACLLSVSACLYTEMLFKDKSRGFSFMEQQFWLYLYGAVITYGGHYLNHPDYSAQDAARDFIREL